MKRFATLVAWTFLFLLLLLGLDQLLLRVPVETRGLREIQAFYLDFRSRALSFYPSPPALLPVPPATQKPAPPQAPVVKPGKTPPKQKSVSAAPHYVYADEQGNLQFAGSLEEVPTKFRREARPLTP